MKHLILDENVLFNSKYSNYRFLLDNGYKTNYFKSDPEIPLNSDNTCKKNQFKIVQNHKTGYWKIVPGIDKTQKCLVMMSVSTATQYEKVKIVKKKTLCKILEEYKSNDQMIKLICVIDARRPLFVKFTNIKTGKERYEVYIYNAIEEKIEKKSIDGDKMSEIFKDIVLLKDFSVDLSKYRVTKENYKNLTKEDEEKAQMWYDKYHSFLKDKTMSD